MLRPLPHLSIHLFASLCMTLLIAGTMGCQSSRAIEPASPPAPAPVETSAPPEQTPPPVAPAPTKVEPETKEQALIRQTFVTKMDAIRTGMDRLGSDEFDTSSYLDALLVAGDSGRAKAFPALLDTLKNRLSLEADILTHIDDARVLYKQFGLATEIERRRLLEMNQSMDNELGLLSQEMTVQNRRLADAFQTDRDMKLFTHFTSQKEQFVKTMQARLEQPQDLPALENYFDRWTELIKTRILADQYQILNLAYYAKAFNYTDGVNDVMNTVASMTAADYLKDVGKESVNAAALTTVLDAGFSEMVKTVYQPTTQDKENRQGFSVSIVPDRGLGGAYYYSDSPAGLQNPTKVTRADGSYYYAERVSFIVKSTRDCTFIMRHVDARGKTTQICPNKYAPNVNAIKANTRRVIPGSEMPFEFATTEPPGIEAIRLIVTPKLIAYNPNLDKLEMSSEDAVEEQLAMSTRGGGTRGLQVQAKQSAGDASSIDQAWYDENQAGNAVQIETFIKVLPLRR